MNVNENHVVTDTVQSRTDSLNLLARTVNNLARQVAEWEQTRQPGLDLGVFTTDDRPSADSVRKGARYFDASLNVPAWSDGSVWHTASGSEL